MKLQWSHFFSEMEINGKKGEDKPRIEERASMEPLLFRNGNSSVPKGTEMAYFT